MAAPTPQEITLLEQFRVKTLGLSLTGALAQDLFLIRWIRARDGDLEKALEMLTKHMAWRKTIEFDDILSWTPSKELVDTCPYTFLGYDDENSPVFLAPMGIWQLKEAASRDKKEYIKYWHQMVTSMLQRSEGRMTKANHPVTQFVFLVDLEEFSFSTLASVAVIDMLMKATKQFEQNHPETTKKIFAFNSSTAFEKLYNMLKPLISIKTQEKVSIMAKKETWLPVLQAGVPADVLPEKYGGQNKVAI